MSSPLIHGGRGAAKAFTLIELLTVIAIIGILAAITFGIVGGVRERGAINLARSQLSVLSQALEEYKRQYGDYPQSGVSVAAPSATVNANDGQTLLFNALLGKLGPRAKDATPPQIDGKKFVDTAKFSLQNESVPTPGNSNQVTNAFVDPWGRVYMYYYRDSTNRTQWKAPSYVLYSVGPDGVHNAPSTAAADYGKVNYDHADNADNIYANR